ncbi:ABC transporter permease [Micropruina sp.]|uniref:ABC transporter permease n=1 Tax=Micropruina sp. TaxID=2737536 RepID=UPI0039E3F0DE
MLKLTRSPVAVIGTLAVLGGMLGLLGGITAAVAGGNPEVIAKAGAAASHDWAGLLLGADQVAAAGALLGFGVVLSWMFAREFTDGTITGLFALPISRGRIALAKLIVYLLWTAVVGLAVTLEVFTLGLLLSYGIPDAATWRALGRLLVLVVLTGIVAVPVAWVATVARSLLAAVGGTILLVVAAQVGALAGAGGWMPLAAPALWALSAGIAVSIGQLVLTMAVSAIFATLTWMTWSRLQLDR